MKLHQLRYIYGIARQGLNVSQAAEVLHTSQSGVSKACQLLEEELNLQIFQRHGKRLIDITEPGKIILNLAERVICELENITRVGEEFTQKKTGTLHIHQGNPTQVAQQVASGKADIGIATEAISTYDKLLCLPCYQWNRCVITPHDYPLLSDLPLTLEKITQCPLITYDFAFTGGSLVSHVFNQAGLKPNYV